METIRQYLSEGQYETAYQLLLQSERRDEEYYICMAAVQEGMGNLSQAQQTAREGYVLFLDSYELVYMLAEYSCFYGKYEAAYAYCLLAESLCHNADKAVIAKSRNSIDTGSMDITLLQKILEDLIRNRMEAGEYRGTYQFLSDILFSENRFLFEKVADKCFRYYYIILEITACEQNHGMTRCAADMYRDWRDFEPVLRRFKFAFRRIWFGFPIECQNWIVQLADDYGVSADFMAVVGKYSVHEDYLADVLGQTAEVFSTNKKEECAKVLNTYASWFRGIHADNREAERRENRDNGLRIVELDCQKRVHTGRMLLKQTEENEISYIMCANDSDYVEEAARYLRRQRLRPGMRATLYVVYNALGMAAGYNYAMEKSEARYKIYIHQDTFLFDEEYTMRLISGLRESDYGLLALAGTVKMPASGRWWDSVPQDKRVCLYQDFVLHILKSVSKADSPELQCPDGVLIATKEDVWWREDLFRHFHFYDVSQGAEFIKKGLKAGFFDNNGVPGVLHEDSISKNPASDRIYEEERKIFVREYLNLLNL